MLTILGHGKNVLNSDIWVDGNAFSGLMLNVLANHRKNG